MVKTSKMSKTSNLKYIKENAPFLQDQLTLRKLESYSNNGELNC